MKNNFVKASKVLFGSFLAIILFTGFTSTTQALSFNDITRIVKVIKDEAGQLTQAQANALSALQSAWKNPSSNSVISSPNSMEVIPVSSTRAVPTSTTTLVNTDTLSSVTTPSTPTVAPVVTGSSVNTTLPAVEYSTPLTQALNSIIGTSTPTPSVIRPAVIGSRGDNVIAIQKILISQGLLPSDTATGYYGKVTAAAVSAFQSKYGLQKVGSVGPKTIRVLSDVSTATPGIRTTDTVSSSSLLVTRNTAYSDQVVSVSTSNKKIGSYYIKNQSATESVLVNNLLVGFTTGGTASIIELRNIKAYNASGVQMGVTVATIASTATVSIPVSTTLAPLASTTIDIYGDIGTAPVGSGWRTNLLARGNGISTGALYHSSSSVSAQNVSIGAGCTPSSAPWVKVSSPNGGETFTTGSVMNISWTTCNISSSTPIQITIRDSRYSAALEAGEYVIVNTDNSLQTYAWTVPSSAGYFSGGTVGGTSIYSIVAYAGGGGPAGFDESDSRFTINSVCLPGTTPSVNLISPNGGESYGPTSIINITWTSCNQPSTGIAGIALIDQATGYNIYIVDPSSAPSIAAGVYSYSIAGSSLASGTYKVRVFCQSPGSDASCIDPAHSEDLSSSPFIIVTTPVAPTSVSTQAATSISSTSAQVHGMGTSNMTTNQGWFNYGTTPSFGSETVHVPFYTHGTNSTGVLLTGLIPNTTYYYRYAMSNGVGVTYGSIRNFVTLP